MLDRRCLALLEIINAECQNSTYKIFAVRELVLSMPERFGIDENGICECLKTLFDHEYISVKYQDDSEICLCPLPKGRLVFENKLEQEIEKEKTRKSYLIYSFLGSFLGGISVTLFAIILLAILWGKRC